MKPSPDALEPVGRGNTSGAKDLLQLLADDVETLRPGKPWDVGALVTLLFEPGKAGRLAALVADAVEKRACVANSSGRQAAGSLFFPAVLFGVTPAMKALPFLF